MPKKERPYKIPRGYIYWKNVCGIIGYFLLNYHPESFHELDPLLQMCVYRTVLWFVQDVPVYCIGTELLGAEVAKDRIVWNQAPYWIGFRANNTI